MAKRIDAPDIILAHLGGVGKAIVEMIAPPAEKRRTP
jgi:hypothetical protein